MRTRVGIGIRFPFLFRAPGPGQAVVYGTESLAIFHAGGALKLSVVRYPGRAGRGAAECPGAGRACSMVENMHRSAIEEFASRRAHSPGSRPRCGRPARMRSGGARAGPSAFRQPSIPPARREDRRVQTPIDVQAVGTRRPDRGCARVTPGERLERAPAAPRCVAHREARDHIQTIPETVERNLTHTRDPAAHT